VCPFCIFFARITFAHALANPSKVTYLSPEMLKTCLLAFSFPSTWIKALAKSWVAKLCHINILSHSNTLNSIKLYISFYKFLAQEYHVQLAKGVLCTLFFSGKLHTLCVLNSQSHSLPIFMRLGSFIWAKAHARVVHLCELLELFQHAWGNCLDYWT